MESDLALARLLEVARRLDLLSLLRLLIVFGASGLKKYVEFLRDSIFKFVPGPIRELRARQ